MSADGSLEAKLDDVVRQYEDLNAQLATPEVLSDPNALRRLGQEVARLGPVDDKYRELRRAQDELAGARQLRDEGDDAKKTLVRDEITHLEADGEQVPSGSELPERQRLEADRAAAAA